METHFLARETYLICNQPNFSLESLLYQWRNSRFLWKPTLHFVSEKPMSETDLFTEKIIFIIQKAHSNRQKTYFFKEIPIFLIKATKWDDWKTHFILGKTYFSVKNLVFQLENRICCRLKNFINLQWTSFYDFMCILLAKDIYPRIFNQNW